MSTKCRTMNRGRSGAVRDDRCMEPVAQCLIRILSVPKVYFDRMWPRENGAPVDIVVIDRAGTGDLHIVKVCRTLNDALETGVAAALDIPAHYRWVCYQGEGLFPHDEESELKLLSEEPLLPETGMGKVGVIEVVRMMRNELGANIHAKAERFAPYDIYPSIEDFEFSEKPDIEFRE